MSPGAGETSLLCSDRRLLEPRPSSIGSGGPRGRAGGGKISSVLTADPCSLLTHITSETRERWIALSRDVDGQRGKITDQSRCEARLALTLEGAGILAPMVTRPDFGDAEDGYGQVWDFKSPRSREAIIHRIEAASGRPTIAPPGGYRGAFDLQTTIQQAIAQQQLGKGVVFDLRRLTVRQAQSLVDAVRVEADIDPALVLFFPRAEDLAGFGEAHGS
jgi:hypothetical protein